jgi:hypothetical protein
MCLEANMGLVNDVVYDAYHTLGIKEKIPKLQTGMFCDPRSPHQHYPLLTGTKCAVTRHFVPVLEVLCIEFNDGSPRDLLRLRCVRALLTYYRILERYPAAEHAHLPEAAVLRLRRAIDTFLICYWKLAYASFCRGLLQWQIVPKFHYFWHVGQQAMWLHPDLVHNYGFEDFMGKIKLICASCTHGMAPAKLVGSATEKYSVYVGLRWHRDYQD